MNRRRPSASPAATESTCHDAPGHVATYAAELAAFDGTDLEDVIGVASIAEVIAGVVEGDWWPGGAVVVVPARSDARSSAALRAPGRTDEIRIAGPQATRATAAHELAHLLAGFDADHGPLFRRAMLDVVAVVTNPPGRPGRGLLHVDQLAAAFANAGLDVAARRWPEPPSGGPIAL